MDLEDPRTGNARLHDFHDLPAIALCATSKEPFLRGFPKLEKGVPSHDTLSRLFRLRDPEQFGSAFGRFVAAFSEA